MNDSSNIRAPGFWSRVSRSLIGGANDAPRPSIRRDAPVVSTDDDAKVVEPKRIIVAPTSFDQRTERPDRTDDKPRTPPSPPPPPRVLGDLLASTPIALTDKAKQAGVTPPEDPRIFVGAQVSEQGGGVKGTLVGYGSGFGGSFIIREANGKESKVSRIDVEPNQQFMSIVQTMPATKVHKVTASEKQGLDALLKHGVGSGRHDVGDAIGAIRKGGFEALIAGGAVRDVLQGTAPRDVDLATTMWIQEADKAMSREGISTGMVRSEYGTMLVGRGSSNALDVCSLKRGKSFGFDLMEDVKSRAFTFNALFYDPANGVILDPTGRGIADAKSKTIRPSCEPGREKEWLSANPSAALRFLKFTLRGYNFDPSLLKLVKDNFASSVRGMDGLRRDRQLDSVDQGSGRDEKITKELERLGFPKSDVEALFPPRKFFGGFGRDKDDDDKPRFGEGGSGGGTRSWTPSSTNSTPSGRDSTTSAPSALASLEPKTSMGVGLYLGPSLKAVNDYASANKKDVVDYGRYNGTAAAKLGKMPPNERDAWSALYPNGWRARDKGMWTHSDGSFAHFVNGNVFRGVSDKVFAGRPPDVGSGTTGSTGSTVSSAGPGAQSVSSGSSLDRLLERQPQLRRKMPMWSEHSKLAVATGHLGRLPETMGDAVAKLKSRGFAEKSPAHWQHPDDSWVRFFDGNMFRGYKNDVFSQLVTGPGPSRSGE